MPACAYCGSDNSLTKEHVTPRFIYSYLKIDGGHQGWNRRVETWKRNLESVTRDVCAECNNGPLARLDAYGKQFFEKNQLHKQTYANWFELDYDYDSLVRWFLKISYNMSRVSALRILRHEDYLAYILGDGPRPDARYLCVFLELLRPLEEDKYPELSGMGTYTRDNINYINPFQFRLFTVKPDRNDPWASRCIQIGGLLFHLMFVDPSVKVGHAAVWRRKYQKMHKNAVALSQNQDKCRLSVSGRTWLQAIMTEDFVRRANAWEP